MISYSEIYDQRTVTGGRVYGGKPRSRRARAAHRELSARVQRAVWEAAKLLDRDLITADEAAAAIRKAGYAAMEPSRLRRQRTGLGGEGDAHLANDRKFWQLREQARDMDRNDALPGPLINRAISMVLGSGMGLDPQTGVTELDAEIRRRRMRWAKDPSKCDVARRHNFKILERLALRHALVDGDSFTRLYRADGAQRQRIQLLEGDRIAGCDVEGKIVHGVELDLETGAVAGFHVLKRRMSDRRSTGFRLPTLGSSDFMRVPAFDASGRPEILQVMDPLRVTQTRGVTRFHRCFDVLGMLDDILFAATQSHQVAACIPAFITSTDDINLGPRSTEDETGSAGSAAQAETQTYEELTPAVIPRLRAGEAIQGVQGAGPPPNLFQHVTLLVRIAALQLDLPYSIGMLDTSGTTFHGYRGEIDQAKRSAKWIQEWFACQWHLPIYQFWLELELEAMRKEARWARLIAKAERKDTLYEVRIQPPSWPYVEPKTDADADVVRGREGLESLRQIAAERGRDLDEMVEEQIDERVQAITSAARKRKALAEALKKEGFDVEPLDPIKLEITRLLPGLMTTATPGQQWAQPRPNKEPAAKPDQPPEPSAPKPEKEDPGDPAEA